MENENETVYDICELLLTVNRNFSYYNSPSYQCLVLCQKTPEDILYECFEKEILWGNDMLIAMSESKYSPQINISRCKEYIEILNKIKNKEEIPFFDTNQFIKEFLRILLVRKYKIFFHLICKTDTDKRKIEKLLYNIELKKKINVLCEYYNIDDELNPPQYKKYVENEKEYLYYLAEKKDNPKLQKYFK